MSAIYGSPVGAIGSGGICSGPVDSDPAEIGGPGVHPGVCGEPIDGNPTEIGSHLVVVRRWWRQPVDSATIGAAVVCTTHARIGLDPVGFSIAIGGDICLCIMSGFGRGTFGSG
jgi:hypothetical protein